jgi:hypothetical protein
MKKADVEAHAAAPDIELVDDKAKCFSGHLRPR